MRFLSAAAVAVLFTSRAALAQPAGGGAAEDCPPGSWFCGKTEAPAPAAAGAPQAAPTPAKADPAPAGGGALAPLPEAKESKAPGETAPPIGDGSASDGRASDATGARTPPARYVYVPREAKPKSEIGVNLHLGGLPIVSSRAHGAGMTVLGAGLRFRPIPELAIQPDFDLAIGSDAANRSRSELGFALNGLLFVNPKNKAQLYFLAGLGTQVAQVNGGDSAGPAPSVTYSYLSAQGGMGVEFRLSKVVALGLDVRGIVRTRVDDRAETTYEFTSTTGQRTNTSGGVLFSGGITFYF